MISLHRTEMIVVSAVFVGWAMLLIGSRFGNLVSYNNFDTSDLKKTASKHMTEKS